MIATLPPKDRVEYPTSDGRPLAETELHGREIIALLLMLEQYFADRADVYVWGNNFIYYEEGNPRACFSPDCYVVFGVEKKERDCYKVWEEGGHIPSVVVEVTSRKTRREDDEKKAKYSSLGIREYFMFDPKGEYIKDFLRGFRLEDGVYVPITPNAAGRLESRELNLELCLTPEHRIAVFDPKTRKQLLRLQDSERIERQNAAVAREIAATESAARRAAEAEVARLKAELARLKKG